MIQNHSQRDESRAYSPWVKKHVHHGAAGGPNKRRLRKGVTQAASADPQVPQDILHKHGSLGAAVPRP